MDGGCIPLDINTLFTIGNALLLIASFPLIMSVWKDRTVLRGFNPYGSLMTTVALLFFNVAYIYMENWWSIALNFSSVIFWGMATMFSWGK